MKAAAPPSARAAPTCARHFAALLWKNWLLKRRAGLASLAELLLPLAFVSVMVILYFQFDTYVHLDQDYVSQRISPLPVGFLPARLALNNAKLAVVAASPATVPLRDAFLAHVRAVYLPLNGSLLAGGLGAGIPLLAGLYCPPLIDAIEVFDSEAALDAYVRSPGYKAPGSPAPAIFAAIVFHRPPPHVDYSIRANASAVPSTSDPAVDVLQRGADLKAVESYVATQVLSLSSLFTRPQDVRNPVLLQPYPGFMTLQLAVDRFLVNASLSPAQAQAALDPVAVLEDLLLPSLAAVVDLAKLAPAAGGLAVLNATMPAAFAQLAREVTAWFRAEAFAPQRVEIVAFPTMAYTTNNFYGTVLGLFAFFFLVVILFPVSRLIRSVVLEKELKQREGMKMMGLNELAWSLSWSALYVAYFCVLGLLVAALTSFSFFRASSFGFTWGFFLLFGIACTSFSQLIAVFFSRSKTASTVGVVLFIGSYMPYFAVQPYDVSYSAKLVGSVMAPTAFALGIDLVGNFEDSGVGASGATLSTFVHNWTLASTVGMLIFDTVLYAVLAWYFDAVLPEKFREYGVPRPLGFPFTAAYWREVLGLPNPPSPTTSTSSPPSAPSSPSSYLERLDGAQEAKLREGRCVQTRGLRKEFDTPDGKKVAVRNVDLTMFEGEIFVLLGHNGAGKTTTISMLTGLLAPTSGAMTFFGRDALGEQADIRRELGVCPQHDVLWPELSVEEHLRLFCAIKGVATERVDAEIAKALREVGLTEKLRYRSGALSGGQRRKLSVCIALCGGSRFILLDEPTSGMDPYSRRSTWQILQNAREGRVLLMTTHFMDEADILGDRVCIMAEGGVKCCGSSAFLKQRFGVGYSLVCVMQQAGAAAASPGGGTAATTAAVFALVRRHVPGVEVAGNVGAELTLRMPFSASGAFPAMMAELEERAAALGVAQFGVSVTSLQEIFMKVARGDVVDDDDNNNDGAAVGSGATEMALPEPLKRLAAARAPPADVAAIEVAATAADASPLKQQLQGQPPPRLQLADARASARRVQTGAGVFARHFSALFMKRVQSSRRDAKAFVYTLGIPIVMTLGGLLLLQANPYLDPPDAQLSTGVLNSLRNSASPLFANKVPFTHFKSGDDRLDSEAASRLVLSMPSPNVTTSDARLAFSAAALQAIDAADLFGFVASAGAPDRDLERLSSFLLADRAREAGSKYLAFALTGASAANSTLVSAQPANATLPESPVLTYAALVNTTWSHAAPTAVNLMSSASYAATQAAAGVPGASISTRTHPLPFTARQQHLISAFFTFSSAIILVLAFSFFPASVAIFVTKEREVSAKHQQLISGVSVYAYWSANYLFDLLSFVVPATGSILLTSAFSITQLTSPDSHRLNAFIVVMALYGASVTPFTYVLSFFFKDHSTAQNVSLIVGVVALVLVIAALIMSQVSSSCRADQRLRFLWRLLPAFSLGNSLVNLAFLDQLPLIDATCDAFSGIFKPISSYAPYDAFDAHATGTNIAYLAVLSPTYLALAVLIDLGLANPHVRLLLASSSGPGGALSVRELARTLWSALREAAAPAAAAAAAPAATEEEDADVAAERARVAASAQRPASDVADVIQLRGLRKVYASSGKVAVRGLSFGLEVGEVFGFLGINGAGKTTTLQMLSGDVLPSGGTALLCGFDILREQEDVRRCLGYCPQWDALFENNTSREHLELYARIKGVPEPEVAAVVQASLEQFDLVPFANKLAQQLSGGNKRKLSVAIALVGDPPIVFLDEPSTGMDPVARRHMWSVISRVATERKQCSIVLTTHSMEEVEALCTKIGIMVGGRLRCLGSSQHLKSRHSRGFVSEIRAPPPDAAELAALAALAGLGGNAGSSGGGSAAASAPAVVARRDLARLAALLGAPADEISESGTGWALHALFEASALPASGCAAEDREVPAEHVLRWIAEERIVARLAARMAAAFPGAALTERQGLLLRFRLVAGAAHLGELFARLEELRLREQPAAGAAGVTYTLSQMALEDVFISFASQQEEETDTARGFGAGR